MSVELTDQLYLDTINVTGDRFSPKAGQVIAMLRGIRHSREGTFTSLSIEDTS
ncbi:hypothetical protein P4S63_25320 [Pseudoalteromonas sp. B193]